MHGTLFLEVFHRILNDDSLQLLEDLVLLVGLKVLGLLLLMWCTGEFEVHSFSGCTKEHLFEMSYEFLLLDCLESFDLLGLSIELVLMRCDLIPESTILSVQVNVFFCDLGMDCCLLDFNNFISDVLDLFPDSNQENVDAVDEELTRFVRALDEELAS